MITIDCPWCHEDELFAWLELTDPEAAFTCADCGTSIHFADTTVPDLELAA